MAIEGSSRSWVHYRARRFGIDDLLLPADHDMKPSIDDDSGGNTLTATRIDHKFQLNIELLFESQLVVRNFQLLETLCNIDPADVYTEVVQSPEDVDLGFSPGGQSRACALHIKPYGDAAPEVTYHVVTKSPFGHGLLWLFRGALADMNEIRTTAHDIISSLKWIDRTLVTKDVSSKLVGAWLGERTLPVYLANDGCRSSETTTINYDAGGRFTASKVISHVSMDTRAKTTESRAMPGGSYKAYQSEDGSVQMLTIGDELGAVTVRNITLVNDDMIEFQGGSAYLHRIKPKVSLFKRATKKLFK